MSNFHCGNVGIHRGAWTIAIVDEFGWPAYIMFDHSLIRAEINEWCTRNCQSDWEFDYSHLRFSLEDDAILFKLNYT